MARVEAMSASSARAIAMETLDNEVEEHIMAEMTRRAWRPAAPGIHTARADARRGPQLLTKLSDTSQHDAARIAGACLTMLFAGKREIATIDTAPEGSGTHAGLLGHVRSIRISSHLRDDFAARSALADKMVDIGENFADVIREEYYEHLPGSAIKSKVRAGSVVGAMAISALQDAEVTLATRWLHLTARYLRQAERGYHTALFRVGRLLVAGQLTLGQIDDNAYEDIRRVEEMYMRGPAARHHHRRAARAERAHREHKVDDDDEEDVVDMTELEAAAARATRSYKPDSHRRGRARGRRGGTRRHPEQAAAPSTAGQHTGRTSSGKADKRETNAQRRKHHGPNASQSEC